MENVKQVSQYLEARIRSMRGDRGDVPGWVMITLMTAAIVAIIWGLAGPWLRGLFDNAMTQVNTCATNNPGSGASPAAKAGC